MPRYAKVVVFLTLGLSDSQIFQKYLRNPIPLKYFIDH